MDMGDTWSARRPYRDHSSAGSSRGAVFPFHLPFSARNMSTRSLSASIASQYTSNTQHSDTAPHLLRARGSETGSIFHEGVWPPPGEESRLVDPLMKASSHVELSRIVDDIMGSSNEQIRLEGGRTDMPIPGSSSQPQRSASSPESYLMWRDSLPPAHTRTDTSTSSYSHSRDASVTSKTGLFPSLPSGAALPKKSSPLAQPIGMRDSLAGSEARSSVNFGGPPTIHWLKRSPRNNNSGLDKGVE